MCSWRGPIENALRIISVEDGSHDCGTIVMFMCHCAGASDDDAGASCRVCNGVS